MTFRTPAENPYFRALQRYEGYRAESFAYAHDQLWPRIQDDPTRSVEWLALTEIDDLALEHWRTRWPANRSNTQGAGGFPWDMIARQIRATPRRFTMAIWANDELHGLVAGMASRGPDNVTLKFIERFPGSNLMKGLIFPLALEAAEAYAVAIERKRVRLKNPVPGAIPWYQRHGFALDKSIGNVSYLAREVDVDGGEPGQA